MDAQYHNQYSYGPPRRASIRPPYPTPAVSGYGSFTDYASSPEADMTYDVGYSYEGFNGQNTSPMQTHRLPMQDQRALELAMAASNLSLRSPTLENFILNNPLPTPPAPSPHNEDLSAETETVVSVSTAFHPTSYPDLPVPDTIFQASDGVLFYAHSNTILSACSSAFRDFIGSPLEDPKYRDNIIPVASTSSEFNVIMHMLYGSSCAPHSPSFENLVNAVDRMPAYSIPPDNHILVATPLYSLLLSHAPINPLDLYALAAFHNIHPLAVATSSHLLSYSLQTISDSQADRMGAMYLKRLMMLHVERFTALKTILLKPPHPHAPTRKCGFIEQRKLTRAWALVSAHLAWDARADMSTNTMYAALNPLLGQLECEDCKQSLRDRIKDLIVQWTSVIRTI